MKILNKKSQFLKGTDSIPQKTYLSLTQVIKNLPHPILPHFYP